MKASARFAEHVGEWRLTLRADSCEALFAEAARVVGHAAGRARGEPGPWEPVTLAARAFAPGHAELPADYRAVGQPVFIPGSMGTASYVLAGVAGAEALSWASACHGAGRSLSRTAVKRQVTGAALRRELEGRGIVVRCPSNAGLAEEAPVAYKDVEHVAAVVERAGLARRVARLRPLGVVKG